MKFHRRLVACSFLMFTMAFLSLSRAAHAQTPAAFPPLEQWKAAAISGNVTTLQALYSSNPPAQVATAAGASSVASEVDFWTGLKARRLKISVVQSDSPQAGAQRLFLQAEFLTKAGPGGQPLYATEFQLWQMQAGQWRIVGTKRSETTKLQQPASISKVIYAPGVDAHSEIKDALQLAAKARKRVLVVFGANWCYDCHVLDLAFRRPEVAAVLQRNFEVVHIDVGEGDKNQDIMAEYEVPMKRGIPAIAVLDSNGKLLYSQKGGEFERARALAPEDVLQFLNKWKPVAR
jgi:thiol-disulfide isomerase/thioredoxin